MIRDDLRNVAIIAHVDHGKTTLVNQMLVQGGMFRANEQVQDRVRIPTTSTGNAGLRFFAKNTSAHYKGVKINIVEYPGSADFRAR